MNKQNWAVIVGGSSGMGKESAKLLAEKGHSLMLIAREPGQLEKTKIELMGLNSKIEVEAHSVDLYDKVQTQSLIQKISSDKRYFKYLINAAGYFKPVSFLEHTEADYNSQLDINKSFFFITQAVAKNMKTNGGGNIVNIGSMWAHQAIKATPSSSYSMQKAGLHSLTQHLAMELAEYNIRVNAVAPAVVLSTIYKSFIEKDKIEESLSSFNGFHPIGRIGKAQDIAQAIDFLLSEKSSWITGEILNIDGGVMAGRN